MLEMRGTIKAAVVRKGADLGEQIRVGEKGQGRGEKKLPVFDGKHVYGLPFGAHHPITPIALEPGDEVAVDAGRGNVIRVERGSKVIWPVA